MWQDVRYGTRMLARNPGFALVAVMSIAIGVGANSAMFSITDGLILRPLAVPDARSLVTVSGRGPDGQLRFGAVSAPDFADLRERVRTFAGLLAATGVEVGLGARPGEPAVSRYGLAVSGNFFEALRVPAAVGRTFSASEDRVAGRDAVVVLSHSTWTQQFAADPSVIGRSLRLGARDFTVIGVAPAGFTGIDIFLEPAFYVPLAMVDTLLPAGAARLLDHRDIRAARVLGRLAPGVSIRQANDDVRAVAAALARTYPDTNEAQSLAVRTELETRMDNYEPAAMLGVLLLTLAIAVLCVACANVAGLLAGRAPARQRELAVRLALGGSRLRLFRQLLTESLLLAAAGGALGVLLGYAVVQSFRQFQILSDVGARLTFTLDERALVAALVVAVVSALLSGLIPAWSASRARDLAVAIRTATTPPRPSRLWGRHGLVAGQIALTLVLLTVAVSMYRRFEEQFRTGPGFRTERLVMISVDPALAAYDATRTEQFFERLEQRARALPGATAVSLTSFVPLSFDGDPTVVAPEGFTLPKGSRGIRVASARIDERYLETLGVRMVRGRAFTDADTAGAPLVAIVSQGMAARYWPESDPVGKRIRVGASGDWTQIVGIAADSKFQLFTPASADLVYLPRRQHPGGRGTLVVATAGTSASIAGPLRALVAGLDPDVPIRSVRTMEDYYDASARNLNSVVVRTVAGMGTMGLVLAVVGLYGLMAYAVSRRTCEIGIRMALGAEPLSVLRMVLRQGSMPAAAGVILGMVGSVATGKAIDVMFPTTSADFATHVIVVPGVALVALLAAYVPARRASRIQPLSALRQD
ncbi:MAG TPA: ABC transporter permease [Vicinamibacterales bacterium]|jgi:predicted permease|nr:ABC transporter permease [Vicinamibacterales bacterium]